MKILSDSRLIGCVLAMAVMAGPLKAQQPVFRACEVQGTCPAWWATEIAVIGANALIGALTGGIWQELRGGSFADGFTRGSFGGVIGYAGKRMSTGRFPGAGLIGRQIGAIGHSVVRNAAENRGMFSRVALPLLFLPARVQLGDWGTDARLRLDAMAAWWFGYGLIEPRLTFDLPRSVSWGAAVFISDAAFVHHERFFAAQATVGTIFVQRALLSEPYVEGVAAHERVHVVQSDFPVLAWSDPLDDWIEERLSPMRSLSRHVAVNSLTLLLFFPQAWAVADLDHYHLPWELEAMTLVRIW